MINVIKNNDFSEVDKSAAAVVDFSATWCGPCQMLAPVFDELAEEMKGKVDFFSCDIDANPGAAQANMITAVPTIMIFKNGKAVDVAQGFQPKANLKQFIEANL
jgi:thioredoxin 1